MSQENSPQMAADEHGSEGTARAPSPPRSGPEHGMFATEGTEITESPEGRHGTVIGGNPYVGDPPAITEAVLEEIKGRQDDLKRVWPFLRTIGPNDGRSDEWRRGCCEEAAAATSKAHADIAALITRVEELEARPRNMNPGATSYDVFAPQMAGPEDEPMPGKARMALERDLAARAACPMPLPDGTKYESALTVIAALRRENAVLEAKEAVQGGKLEHAHAEIERLRASCRDLQHMVCAHHDIGWLNQSHGFGDCTKCAEEEKKNPARAAALTTDFGPRAKELTDG